MSIFEKIPEDKREKLLEACYVLFAKEGYKNTSVNAIVKKAGISKGLLYHYFESKEELYKDLLQFSSKVFMDKYLNNVNISDTDFLERIRSLTLLKYEILKATPDLLNYFSSLSNEDAIEIKAIRKETTAQIENNYKDLAFGNIDYSLFRDDIDTELAIESIIVSLENLATKLKSKHFKNGEYNISDEAFNKELNKYMDFFRTSYYKL